MYSLEAPRKASTMSARKELLTPDLQCLTPQVRGTCTYRNFMDRSISLIILMRSSPEFPTRIPI